MVKVLLSNQWRIMVNTLRSQPNRNYVSYVVMVGILALFLYFLSDGVMSLGESISEPILAGILSYGFLASIGFVVLLGLPQVFKHLYAATDLNLLFTMPIPTRHIFWVKYLQSFFGIPLLVYILLGVPLFIYGTLVDVNLLYYPVVLLVLASVLVIGLSFAYLFNLVLIQIVPASKANEFMTVMSVLSGIFVYMLFMIPNIANERPLSELLLSGLPIFPGWVPVTWASDAIIRSMNGEMDFVLPFFMILIFSVVCILLTSTLVEKGFRTGWVRLNEGSIKKKGKKKQRKDPALHHPIVAIGKKEWFAIKRDLREWLVFMPIVFFFVFGIFGFLSSGSSLSDLQGPNEISWPIGQGALLFIYCMFNGQIASATIAREGQSLWILRILPLSGRDIALGKLWISWFIPFVILSVIEIVIGIFLDWTPVQLVSGIAMKAFITAGISAIGMWLGTIGAKHNPANPQNRLTFSVGFILLISSYVYVIFSFIPYVLLIVPTQALGFVQDISQNSGGFFGFVASFVYTMLSWKEASPAFVGVIGIVIMLFFSLGMTYLLTMASARRIEKGIKIEVVRQNRSTLLRKKSGGLF
ncbi:putative ABC transporter permease subunit [Terrihalobacillus insolitus]|uniref:putative ABC transporter permease subunit n=1 Tax=Terrihalobacillus insolitus TaxID=2950438 RepID=UPI0023401A40|nr:hypothetical protein [Terrihalobacillus insolitus]MDC3413889.1 hypothetical protein [Terrihalobacillus insolitus]